MVDVVSPRTTPSGGGRGPRLRADDPFSLGLIAAAMILGAGIFKLPAEVARVGWLPVVALGAVTWLLSRRAYRRQNDVTVAAGAKSYGDVLASGASADAAQAGRQLGLFGAFAYIIPANIAYTTLGAGVASWAVDGVRGNSVLAAALLGVGLVLCILSTRPLPLAGRIRLVGVWSAGIGSVALVPGFSGNGFWATAAAGAIYVTGALVATGGGTADEPSQEEAPAERVGLDPSHQIPAFNLCFYQVPLMALLGAMAVYVVVTSDASWHVPAAIGGTGGDLLIAFGTLMFAAVGAFTPLAIYPAMRDRGFSHQVVDKAMWFILALKVAWIATVVVTISSAVLLDHSGRDQTSAQAMAGLVSSFGPPWMGALAAATAVLAFGIGLTGAGAGFSETLAIELRSALEKRAGATNRPVHRMQRAIIVGCALLTPVVALGFQGLADALLAIGGVIGGATLVNITGAIAEEEPARRARAAIEARTSAVLTGLLTILLVAHTVEPAYRNGAVVLAGTAASFLCWLTVRATVAPVRARAARGAVTLITAMPLIVAFVVLSF